MEIKYFDSHILLPYAELSAEQAEKSESFNKVYIENNHPVYSELFQSQVITKVVYFERDPGDENLIKNHLKKYPNVSFHICNRWKDNDLFVQQRFYFSEEGKLISYYIFKGVKEWEWDLEESYDPDGRKREIIKYIYNENGEMIKEEHYKGDGTFFFDVDVTDEF